jgi:hypothetical protein
MTTDSTAISVPIATSNTAMPRGRPRSISQPMSGESDTASSTAMRMKTNSGHSLRAAHASSAASATLAIVLIGTSRRMSIGFSTFREGEFGTTPHRRKRAIAHRAAVSDVTARTRRGRGRG